ncbi:NADPH-dependent 7-cyano-7-deazaguanine reductase QueF [Ketobacter sp.]|uniref:NADPH-dependent 7-cyano-7-deazaguanine reductase QueF n=1 Tax=Ketobacter sp. TaxID=2083498 RepID=UPI000F2BB15A|nr:NADPH-dependent 7-cyano-7-deazaguanine reductase QueF [Ketobacter sp.]RLT98053.1 MAG: NADPH-dependent 7-cyano-7-deazaguanine reductase QueF [Ketobacter sp.]
MSEQTHGPLGQTSSYPDQYDPGQLYPIPRESGRVEIGVSAPLPFYGEDIWNAYEVSWLNGKGKPVVAMMELRVPATSPNIVESKSLKLYLGSFNQWAVDSTEQLQQTITRDLAATVGAEVGVRLLPLQQQGPFAVQMLPGRCLDELDVEAHQFEVDASLLRVKAGHTSDVLHSHLLRSCCPVTGQPDWGSVLIEYEGPQICEEGLLQYLISFRNNQEFHEQCVERIFTDISRRCAPQRLAVYARYTRRGGIDINPYRSSQPGVPSNLRLVRQ